MGTQLNFHSQEPLKVTVTGFSDFVALDIKGDHGNNVTYYIRSMTDVNNLLVGIAELAREVALLEEDMKAQKEQQRRVEGFASGISTFGDEDTWVTINCREEN